MISLRTITAVSLLPPSLRARVGEGGGRESPCQQSARRPQDIIFGVFGALLFLTWAPACANEGEARWRFSEDQDRALLAITDTDEATDNFGSPHFRCKRGSGAVEVEGTAKQDLRTAMADLIREDVYPLINLHPFGPDDVTLIELSYSELFEGWQYRFTLPAVGPTFQEFKRTGQLTFKVRTTVIREQFKKGLESAVKFQDSCKRPPK